MLSPEVYPAMVLLVPVPVVSITTVYGPVPLFTATCKVVVNPSHIVVLPEADNAASGAAGTTMVVFIVHPIASVIDRS